VVVKGAAAGVWALVWRCGVVVMVYVVVRFVVGMISG